MKTDMATLYARYPALARVERRNDHRLQARLALVNRLPKRSRGAEIGVFTGVFTEFLIANVKPVEFWAVDAWDIHGGTAWEPPKGASWSAYVDHGNLTYEAARAAATARAGLHTVVTAESVAWLDSRPEGSLDWVYLDTSHHYDATLAELAAAARVIAHGGLITGDDAWEGDAGPNFGVLTAIRDFTRSHPWEVSYLDRGQFVLRRDT